MAWRVESLADRGRFVAWGSDGLDADAVTRARIAQLADGTPSLPLTVTGPFHDVDGLGDEMGVYLLATLSEALALPRRVVGTPPRSAPAPVPDGATP